MKHMKHIKLFENFKVNEIKNSGDKYDQWRKKYNGKTFLKLGCNINDVHGNKFTYNFSFEFKEGNHNESITADELLLSDKTGAASATGNMQNKERTFLNYMGMDWTLITANSEDFVNTLIDLLEEGDIAKISAYINAEVFLVEPEEDMDTVETILDKWLETGTYRKASDLEWFIL